MNCRVFDSYIKMAILHHIVILLACALCLQALQVESSYEFSEERITTSSSVEEIAIYKKEVKLVKAITSYVTGLACVALRAIDVDCLVTLVLDISYTFKHTSIRVLYALAYLSEKLIKCISRMSHYVGATIINSLPPCLQSALYATGNFCKSSLAVVTEILRLVFNFAKDVASCMLSLVKCIKTVFDTIFSSAVRIIQSIVENTQEVMGSVFERPTGPKRILNVW